MEGRHGGESRRTLERTSRSEDEMSKCSVPEARVEVAFQQQPFTERVGKTDIEEGALGWKAVIGSCFHPQIG